MKRAISLILGFLLLGGCFTAFAVSDVSAKSYVVINGHTGTVLNQKNAYTPMSMASTTKIMTAVLLLEKADLEQNIVTTKEMITVEGSSMGLLEGDSVSYKALLVGLLLASGNDAANTIAISLAGDIDTFVKWMNDKATALGMLDTHFSTPSGLDADDHYSTAYDMAILAAYAMKIPVFYEVVSSKSATIEYGNPPYKRTLYNHNKLLNLYEGVCGVKTGYTKKSGRCLVSAAKNEDAFLIVVTLNAPDDWNDHILLYSKGFSDIKSNTLQGLTHTAMDVIGGVKQQVLIEASPCSVGLSQQEAANIKATVCLPDFLYAPIQSGQKIGEVVYTLNGIIIKKNDILSSESIEMATQRTKSYWQNIWRVFKKLWI